MQWYLLSHHPSHWAIPIQSPHFTHIPTSWVEQFVTNAFCPACRESAPPGVLKASELDLYGDDLDLPWDPGMGYD